MGFKENLQRGKSYFHGFSSDSHSWGTDRDISWNGASGVPHMTITASADKETGVICDCECDTSFGGVQRRTIRCSNPNLNCDTCCARGCNALNKGRLAPHKEVRKTW